MPYCAKYRFRVRSYELDVYGHVNNAVFMQWLEHGRSRLLQDKGLTYTSIVDEWGVRLVTVATSINFRAQLGLDDDVEVRTSVKRMGNSSVAFDQTIIKFTGNDETIAADCETTICFTGPEMKKSKPIPRAFRELYG
jgi:thioesterase III